MLPAFVLTRPFLYDQFLLKKYKILTAGKTNNTKPNFICPHFSVPVVVLMDSLIKLTQESCRANTVMA